MVSIGEANKLIADFKYKLTKAEQEIASLQASLARSETQVIRYKSTADAAEKVEAELKIERRKLQREVSQKVFQFDEIVSQILMKCFRVWHRINFDNRYNLIAFSR